MAELIRFAAAEMLDMDLEDLQVLVLGRADSDEPDALLYDPMPGGSGLLDQICLRFGEIVDIARRLANGCAGRCATSCIDCFQTYRNAFYHIYLDRHIMVERLEAWGGRLEEKHPIPPKQPGVEPRGKKQPVNVAEQKLRQMLLTAGLPEGSWQEQHLLPKPLGSTTPDVTFRDPDEEERKICVYLDGLSKHIHGNPETADRDCQIRAELRAEGHDVIAITAVDLDDEKAMTRHLKRLARALIGRDAASRVQTEASTWFQARGEGYEPEPDLEPRIAAEAPGTGNADLDASLEYATEESAALIRAVHDAGGPLPVVGFEMVDKAGRVVAEADLAWEEKKLAVLDPDQSGNTTALEKAGWMVMTHPADLEKILGHLGLERGPDPDPVP